MAGHEFKMKEGKSNFKILTGKLKEKINTFKYHVFAPMGRFQLELIYLYFPPSSHLIYVCFCPVGLSLLLSTVLVGAMGRRWKIKVN